MAGSLEGCVASLRSSMQLLDSSISILDSGVKDFPRLSRVLQTTRHFEIISEPELHAAQSALVSEIRPEVDALLGRVAAYLDKLERRERSLIAKYDLQAGRLSSSEERADKGAAATAKRQSEQRMRSLGGAGGAPGPEKNNPLAELKMKQLRQKKERLSYAVDRLTLQAQQRERQLRMSMAAPQQRLD
ncbi:mitotic spindle biogenesis protein-like protein Spc19 [Lineolata rhizophorae]|uniref:DASH complex subunit SPC19 n=1 Tax=Lineolata rhizophorae TaxID=578093 RepID=A0A6A6PBA8_9PEZI|nr:mitotic spindle biogenesis protein-like protein Spc19 [Lineolata rhizophorae]